MPERGDGDATSASGASDKPDANVVVDGGGGDGGGDGGAVVAPKVGVYWRLTWAFRGAVLCLLVALLLRSPPYPSQARDQISRLLGRIRGGYYYHRHAAEKFSLSVADCPGYDLDPDSLRETRIRDRDGFTAQLNLAGPPCNAFGEDVLNLTIEVTYDTASRLRVNIFETSLGQFILPPGFFPGEFHQSENQRHGPRGGDSDSDLQFNYEPSPFAFWITRRSDPGSDPIFDTRLTSLPPAPIPAFRNGNGKTEPGLAFDGFPLVFEDRYSQLTSALPLDTNIYGLGEVVASSGFRRDVLNGTVQTMWNRDKPDPLDENIYGSHPVYLEHRWVPSTKSFHSHGVFFASAAGADVILASPPSLNHSLIQYRNIGNTLDLYFFSGPDPKSVIEQYGQLVGFPARPPNWGFGFHLCRWGYSTLLETKEQVDAMRAANIPLEVMWNDLELYHDYRDFTVDPVKFPADEMRDFIRNLRANGQHYIPIVHAYAAVVANATDVYDPYTRGVELDVFLRNPDRSLYIGQVWPGHTVFPDWISLDVQLWWNEALRNWTALGVEFSGLWLDMNEPSSFCDGHCPPVNGKVISSPSIILPGDPGNLVTDYPEGYNAAVSGPSGNITVNGSLTYGAGAHILENNSNEDDDLASERLAASSSETPYLIHNAPGDLSIKTVATSAKHYVGYTELELHNLFGHLMSIATNIALREMYPGKRQFLISRSTFAGSGRVTGHWLGDNLSKWSYLYHSIQGVLQFQLFQIPMVGADACGFLGNVNEELCNRWMQLAAFTPFFRNHNIRGAIPQEPYRWDSVAHASRAAIAVRYALLPYWYTLFANASRYGTPPVRALFFEFPQEPELLAVDRQFMVGSDILVTPVLTPNVTSVSGILPGRGQVIWRDWYSHAIVGQENPPSAGGKGSNTDTNTVVVDLDAPLGHIPVLVRSGAALLLHSQPGYTTSESAASPYALLVSLSREGNAYGTALIDDGETETTPSRTLVFNAHDKKLEISTLAEDHVPLFEVVQPLGVVTVLGIDRAPKRVRVDGKAVPSRNWTFDSAVQRLVISGLSIDLNGRRVISWG